MAWSVEMGEGVEEQLVSDFTAGRLTREDAVIMKKWIAEIEGKGLEETQGRAAWRDHELKGKWAGHRAISISHQGRLIYRVEEEKVVVLVVKVTPDHDYS